MKKIYSAFYLSLLLLLISTDLKAQDTYQPGYVILNDGTRVPGLIRLNQREPWYNQRVIFMKDSAAVAADPNGKVKSKKYKFTDMKSYQVGQVKFEKVHYVDMENLQLKSLGSNDHMLEVLSSGRINSYRYYSYPPDIEADFGTEEEQNAKEEKRKKDLINGFKILTKKDNESKFNDALDYDVQKYFKDAPEILEKYQKGEYGNQPTAPKKGLAAKMIAMAKKQTFKLEEANAIITAFNEYNQKNAATK
ncbi:hypothetical protein [Mucilaginibacter ginsenosidivorans]|uniref:DUF4369 domain-containing protein n=1 Tax=Mucilaginibacter ginsenosidivorans TaxID=398053 RepID=A0A5B8V194_9SPHI|nr:hypothetical protein [Mucilaginibacter ginsenosidivorans]QEC64929.1 hypothetical protein FRZ54_20940 [Mucilaginibacter ginsenosidivorans]